MIPLLNVVVLFIHAMTSNHFSNHPFNGIALVAYDESTMVNGDISNEGFLASHDWIQSAAYHCTNLLCAQLE